MELVEIIQGENVDTVGKSIKDSCRVLIIRSPAEEMVGPPKETEKEQPVRKEANRGVWFQEILERKVFQRERNCQILLRDQL